MMLALATAIASAAHVPAPWLPARTTAPAAFLQLEAAPTPPLDPLFAVQPTMPAQPTMPYAPTMPTLPGMPMGPAFAMSPAMYPRPQFDMGSMMQMMAGAGGVDSEGRRIQPLLI